jgi:prolyl-tRNA editing enzyme YbaK/EbsC (Cys-tRNA(Pro) deacylase)
MQIGNLSFNPIAKNPTLVAEPVWQAVVQGQSTSEVYATPIDPELADTASFCKQYNVLREIACNCIIVEAKRADSVWYAACVVLADDMIDVNGKVRRHLGARKASFAPKDTVLRLTKMEYGGITPLGLPEDWPIFIDEKVSATEQLILGGGVRGSKILVETKMLISLVQGSIIDITK